MVGGGARNTVAMLTAARLLREQGKPEAQALLGQILAARIGGGSTGGRGSDPAIQLAMRAEAHALLSQWARGPAALPSGHRPDSRSHDQAGLVVQPREYRLPAQ